MAFAEELNRLGDLKDRGLLTQAEFDEQKATLLRASTAPPTAADRPAGAPARPGVMLGGMILLVAVLAGGAFLAYRNGLFGSARTSGVATPVPAGTGAAGTAPTASAQNPGLAGVTTPTGVANPGAGTDAIPVTSILAAFKANPAGAAAQYPARIKIRGLVQKVNGSGDAMRFDGGDPSIRVLVDMEPGTTFDRALIGQVVTLECQAPRYPTIDDETFLSIGQCIMAN